MILPNGYAPGKTIVVNGAIMIRVISYDPRYRDDMIYVTLSAKDALGCVPRLNEDLLDVPGRYLQSGGGFFLALDGQDRVAGCIGVLIDGASARLHRLYVKPALKRQGIGSLLLARAERFAVQHGAEEAVVHMGDPRFYWESIPFYEKHGYLETEPRWRKKRWGKVSIQPHTQETFHQFYSNLEQDPLLFAQEKDFKPYIYDEKQVQSRYQQLQSSGDRLGFTIFLEQTVIGQIDLKHIDPRRRTCEMGICLCRDEYKDQGYGTRAEALAVAYAFQALQMESILANCVKRNLRSRHVLESLGFRETHQDQDFVYYQLDKKNT